jgi:hypothetical protein
MTIGLLVGVIGIAAALFLMYGRPLLARLRGDSRIAPLDLLEDAREQARLGPDAKLAALEATVDANGKLPGNVDEGDSALGFTFAAGSQVADVRLRSDGVWATGGGTSDLPVCERKPCVLDKTRPHCSIEALWGEALSFGASRRDRATISLSVSERGPVWAFTVAERGTLLIEDATCRREPRSRILPPPRAATDVPGAIHAVAPRDALDVARGQAGLEDDAELNEMTVRYVDRSGHVDLDGPQWAGTIEFVFSDPPNAPVRRRRRVTVTRDGVVAHADAPGSAQHAVLPPRCEIDHVMRRLSERANDVVLIYQARTDGTQDGEWLVHAGSEKFTLLDRDCTSGLHRSNDD